ncbi:MAG: DMT family transporter, partial [Thaumarchaeota archaeon]|nr:DMT family transporter [Nitrososphaerota archaeon]
MSEELAAAFALGAAFGFATRSVILRKGVVKADPFTGVFISLLVSLPTAMVVAFLNGEFSKPMNFGIIPLVSLALAGLLHFLVGRGFTYASIKAIGASRTETLINTQLILSTSLGVLLLSEELTASLLIGIALVLAGIMLISLEEIRRERNVDAKGGGTWKVKGLIYGALAGVVTGVTPFLVRVGVNQFGPAIVGNIVSTIFALSTSIPIVLMSKNRYTVTHMDSTTLRLLTVSGFFAGLAQIFRYLALSIAPIVFVAPIMQTNILFTLLLSFVFIQRLEKVNPLVVAGALMVIIGAVA